MEKPYLTYFKIIICICCYIGLVNGCSVSICTCHDIWIKSGFLKTLSCPKKNMSQFPVKVENTTQFMRLEGNRIKQIPYNLSQKVPLLERIDMSGNKVTRLRSRIFAGLKNLNAVNLVNNDIMTLDDRIFEGSESREMNFKLRGNRLREIHEDAFRGLYANSAIDLRDNALRMLHPNTLNGVRVLTLDLSHNKLNGLPEGLFENQDQLYFLELGQNNISSLTSRVFDGLTSLETLDLSSNELSGLPEDLFKENKLKAIDINLDSNQFTSPPVLVQAAEVTITLKDNPIICDCNLKNLLSNTSYRVVFKDMDKVTCFNESRSVQNAVDEMDCRTTTPPPTTTTQAPTTNFTSTLNTSTITIPPVTNVTATNSSTTQGQRNTSSTTTTRITTAEPTVIKIVKTSTTASTLRPTTATPTTVIKGVKDKTGMKYVTVIVTSIMVTVFCVAAIGLFCYIKRAAICRHFKYEGDRPWKTMYARNRGKFRLNDRRRDSCSKHQSSEYLGWLTLVDALEAAKT